MHDVMSQAEGLVKRYGPAEAVAGHDVVCAARTVRA